MVLPIELALVDETGTVDAKDLANMAELASVQLVHHLSLYWAVKASMKSYAADARPAKDWSVRIVKSLPPGEGGFHLTENGQPYAEIVLSDIPSMFTDITHESCEMLVDPSGNRLQTAPALTIAHGKIVQTSGTYRYLVEVDDPVEARTYDLGGLPASDFLTAHFWTPGARQPGVHYSYLGSCGPMEILPGGYISWIDEDNEWFQILWIDPSQPPQLVTLGAATSREHGFRGWIDSQIAQRQP